MARRLGFTAAFPYETPADIFREHATLTGFENGGSRAFDISGLADLTDAAYEALAPVQWPVTSAAPHGTERLYTDKRFFHPSGKACMLPITPRPPADLPNAEYPLVLNTGRVRDQWHTMTRTGKVARLLAHASEPYVEIHPDDARTYGVQAGAIARLASTYGEMLARVQLSADQRRGSVFVPIHWNDTLASRGRADALVNPATDPISGQPEFKHTPVRVEAYAPPWHAFLLSREPIVFAADYQVKVKGEGYWRYEIAGEASPAAWPAQAREWLSADGEWLEFEDAKGGRYRAARIESGRLSACIFVGPTHELPVRAWLQALFTQEQLRAEDRFSLLSGRAPAGTIAEGPIVCSCFGVGRERITAAIRRDGLSTPQAIGAKLRAGTNCGSCIPELKALIVHADEGVIT
jgi:assimilatory nitrate reductase catalytic subunit